MRKEKRKIIKLYHNKSWLESKYINEKMTINKIAKLCEVTYGTIYEFMEKYDIPRRTTSEANHLREGHHCNLFQKAMEWINGELLGDGYLRSDNVYSARFVYTSKHSEYIHYVADIMKSFGIKTGCSMNPQIDKRLGNVSYKYGSYLYEELLPIYKKWYPKGKKIVPKDIKLTPLTCRQWYIGDGCLQHSKRKMKFIALHTNGFKPDDVEWLKDELIKMGFKSTRRKSDNAIGISTYSTKDFLDYIGKCPVKCYEYKWNY